jgi:hypothetical protein
VALLLCVAVTDTLAALARVKRDGKHILAMHDASVYATYPTGVQRRETPAR